MKNKFYIVLLLLFTLNSCKQKEDLSSFTIMNNKVEESIENNSIVNSTLLDIIYNKAKNEDKFVQYKEKADKVHEISGLFTKYLSDLKNLIKEKKSTEFVDEYFFNGIEIANGGEEFLNYIENYKSSLIATVALSNPSIAGMVKSTFDVGSIEDRKGKQTNWLTLNYKGFPSISSVVKLSEMQADVKQIEKSFLEAILNVKLEKNNGTERADLFKKNKVAVNTQPKKQVVKAVSKPVIKSTPKVTSKSKTHTVNKGETIYQISKKYNVTTTILKKMNGMTNNNLVVGQKLKVRK